jgi:hypothetical protein
MMLCDVHDSVLALVVCIRSVAACIAIFYIFLLILWDEVTRRAQLVALSNNYFV